MLIVKNSKNQLVNSFFLYAYKFILQINLDLLNTTSIICVCSIIRIELII